MSRHHDKMLAHAERQLATAGAQQPTQVLPIYKKFLKIEEHRLRLKHQAGASGREVCRLRVDLIDVLLRRVFAAANAFAERENGAQPTPLSLMALGGYGRGQLNPFSDVDVMFLHSDSDSAPSPYAQHVIEQILYLLWDIGFKVGHSSRSIDEAVAQANSEMLTKTAMLESRLVAGDTALPARFRERFVAECVAGHEREYIEARLADQAARHAKFTNSVYIQEPNIKMGCGGLRDYHNLLWITSFKDGSLTTTHLPKKDWLSAPDRRRIETAFDFLLRLRNDLHYATGRATDILHLAQQEQIALRLGYRQRRGALRSEVLMKDYFEHARCIFRIGEWVTEQFASGRWSGAELPFQSHVSREAQDEEFEGFIIRGDQISASRPDIFEREPELLMRGFEIVQARDLSLDPELADLITRNLGLVTKTFRYAKAPREVFKTILSRKGKAARVLRLMHETDFLGRYLPEFGELTCLVQHEFFHRYTADEHTLVCIDKLDALASTEDPKFLPYREIFERLEDPFVLYLALLLHDTGRAVGARPHSEASAVFAQRAALRLQLTPQQRRSLIRLVDHHVTMSNLAQQRNLDDPETAIEFAAIVKDRTNLDALMLLTLADGQGTSAEGWSDWKESLVWQLHHSTSRYLADQESFYARAAIARDQLETAVRQQLAADFADEIDAHFEYMPDNYFRAFDVDAVAGHIALFREFFVKILHPGEAPLAPATHWQHFPARGHSILSVALWDVPQLLAKIAGSLAVVPLNILSADIYPRGDNLVLDVFRICDLRNRAVLDSRDQALVEMTLRHALATQEFDFRPLLTRARKKIPPRTEREIEVPTRITVDNKAHRAYTLVQIQTPDRVGLLYDLLTALTRESIAIVLSRISTENGAAIDTLYVVDAVTRGKITDPVRIAALQERLRDVAVVV